MANSQGFIRPEVAQTLHRWRETLIGFGAALLGSYWMITQPGALQLIGTALAVGGALMVFAGIQRARFRQGTGGPGVVQVNEGQFAYFGPVDGGVVDIAGMSRLTLEPLGRFGTRWVVWHDAGPPLSIPVNAEGAEALFDVFASLPGMATSGMIAELRSRPREPVMIWERDPLRLH